MRQRHERPSWIPHRHPGEVPARCRQRRLTQIAMHDTQSGLPFEEYARPAVVRSSIAAASSGRPGSTTNGAREPASGTTRRRPAVSAAESDR